METNKDHFEKLYWFAVSLVYAGMIFLCGLCWFPPKDTTIANVTFGFITGSVITSGVAFLIGGMIRSNKKPEPAPGTTSADITATVTTTNESKN